MNRQTDTFVNNLTQAARDNPLAAALIGGGALWLLLGNRAFGAIASGAASAAQPVAEAGLRGASSAAEGLASAGNRATDAISEAARSMTRAASDAAASGTTAIKDRASEGFSRTAEALGSPPDLRPYFEKGYSGLEKGYSSAQSAVSDLLERQPLVLGAVGLAIGAGFASAIASTSIENEWAGSLSDEFKDAAKDRAERVTETAKRAAGEVGSEFRAAASDTADKLRKTGEEAVRTVKETADAGREF
jgi:hypothetical protein